MIRFICGCTSKMELPIDEEIFKTFDSVVVDEEGYIACLVHHERRYGWRSVPYSATAPQQALTASMTPLEHEKWVVWGELPKLRSWPVQSRVEDRRDNRDPQELGFAIMSSPGSETETNGSLSMDETSSLRDMRRDWPR